MKREPELVTGFVNIGKHGMGTKRVTVDGQTVRVAVVLEEATGRVRVPLLWPGLTAIAVIDGHGKQIREIRVFIDPA